MPSSLKAGSELGLIEKEEKEERREEKERRRKMEERKKEKAKAREEERREKGKGCHNWELGRHHAARRRENKEEM